MQIKFRMAFICLYGFLQEVIYFDGGLNQFCIGESIWKITSELLDVLKPTQVVHQRRAHSLNR